MKRRTAILVSVIGIDGAGKTSACKKAVREISEHGFDAEYVYARYAPRLTLPLMMITRTLLQGRLDKGNEDIPVDTKLRRRFLRRPIISKLYLFAVISDYFIQLVMRVWIPYLRGRVLVCDRYIHDTVVTDLAVNLGWSLSTTMHWIRLMERIAPVPTILIYISVRPETAMARKDDVPNLDYLRERARVYDCVAQIENLASVDGNLDEESVACEVMRRIWMVI